jgi:choline dehydrogenase-like flavoprotein
MHDFAVVGAGAAGTFAALGLQAHRPLVLDVGVGPEPALPEASDLASVRQSGDPFPLLIGRHYESLHNIEGDELTPKVKAPFMRYVVREPDQQPPIRSVGCRVIASYAAGGLANAWGAQVYRFNDEDLAAFPIDAAELAPYYDQVESEIGVSGGQDDLSKFHGEQKLLPPLRLSRLALDLLVRYERKRSSFRKRGVRLGRPRLAVLSMPHRGRAATVRQPRILSPAHLRYLLARLHAGVTRAARCDRLPGRLVGSTVPRAY